MNHVPRRAELAGRPVTVMGLGLFGGGAATARWLARAGARVTVTDLRTADELAPSVRALDGFDVRFALGGHREADFATADLVVANPAVPPASPWLARARAAGVPVSSEMELFLRHCRARVALVTGTQGKSSTACVLAQLLSSAGLPARLGGNIGASLLDELDAIGDDEVCVVEISSYQLEALGPPPAAGGPRVEVAAVTNVLRDHLERHGTPEAYAAAKARVLELVAPGGTAWVPLERAGDPLFLERLPAGVRMRTHAGSEGRDGAELRERRGRFELAGPGRVEDLGAAADVALPGRFQRANVALALGVARSLGAPAGALGRAIPALRGLPHRCEELAPARGRRIVDNGVSTTPDSTLSALAAADDPCTLLLGGQRKRGLELGALAAACAARGARAVVFGAAAAELSDELARSGVAVVRADTLEAAAAMGLDGTPPGGTLLFSPACASFDGYLNFRERALAFRRAMDDLRGE